MTSTYPIFTILIIKLRGRPTDVTQVDFHERLTSSISITELLINYQRSFWMEVVEQRLKECYKCGRLQGHPHSPKTIRNYLQSCSKFCDPPLSGCHK